ncbi:uncharacterized protein HaLaN_29101 [Haematococcus lacustris]|uniref:Uncharacterized protein n=1 Tax=Haematococcus lacustris TaxID=44745 RepID=A0A6A0ABR1_HAELA|nr:uncharacterized protein HaLaN_29101 [Haematococcus lacustris]
MAALQGQPKADRSLGGRSQSETDVGMSQERIKQLMKGDPKFIARLIEQLDKQMHGLMLQRQKRQAQLDADLKEMAQLDHTIATNIAPNLGQDPAAGPAEAAAGGAGRAAEKDAGGGGQLAPGNTQHDQQAAAQHGVPAAGGGSGLQHLSAHHLTAAWGA